MTALLGLHTRTLSAPPLLPAGGTWPGAEGTHKHIKRPLYCGLLDTANEDSPLAVRQHVLQGVYQRTYLLLCPCQKAG